MEENKQSVFEVLSSIKVNEHLQELGKDKVDKNGNPVKPLRYLPWAWALTMLLQKYPDAKYRIINFDENGIELPEGQSGLLYQTVFQDVPKSAEEWAADVKAYKDLRTDWINSIAELKKAGIELSKDELDATKPPMPPRKKRAVIGYYVWTEFTIDGITKRQWLAILDLKNNVIKDGPYTKVIGSGRYANTVAVNSTLDAFILNKAIMRCLAKNIAVFGLGLYVYSGEDLPVDDDGNADSASADLPLEEALTHTIQSPLAKYPQMKGKVMSELITQAKNQEVSMKILTMYANPANKSADGNAARALLAGLEAGQIQWPEAAVQPAQNSKTEEVKEEASQS